ncbi:transporter substrate-binding domain-containing protein [Thalassotalea psychrophila]|uniref:Transporter substrate-binding domain-containing protein n=1 Tax=Thalassotalea psychrophila TaxID=3065647 RepID=A0ABY9TNV3_9GAMM|nr:transporter substrate-binding domain-containing protein [Colwelliaceae bacterium SQ149]
MLRKFIFLISFMSAVLLPNNAVLAETDNGQVSQQQILRIGTMHSPPFSIKNSDNSWSGISIELWREIAIELNIEYVFEESTLPELLDGVQQGDLDAVIAAITITEEREALMDFTHPHHTTGFAIATKSDQESNIWESTFFQLFSWQFIKVVGTLFLLLFFVGWLMWLVEHKHKSKCEDSHTIQHVNEGFWWAAATMTTVGYGDKTPLTKVGRAIGVVWMFTALMIVASFIAAFSSILTVQKINTNIQSLHDLNKMHIATLDGSTSEIFLKNNGYMVVNFANISDGLEAVAQGKMDAMVYDAPLLQYFIETEFKGEIEISPATFERQDYGFALTQGSELREPLNRVLLRIVRNESWREKLEKYLGK